jgi:KUP system potassium uptake protein
MAYLAIGGILGDIGTSPLYVMSIVFGRLKTTQENVMGILSLITLSFIFLTLKYAYLALNLDNEGEGGTFALQTRIKKEERRLREHGIASKRIVFIVVISTVLSLFSGALLLSDGIITPSISVLSAIEGIQVVYPHLHNWVIPITILILMALFSIQKRGTEKVARLFSPVMIIWFAAIGVLGIMNVVRSPWILRALNPLYALRFLAHAPPTLSFTVMGIVFLCITGGEALYADMSHYSKNGIRMAWGIAAICLLINYFGQGAYLLRTGIHKHLFFAMGYQEGTAVYGGLLILASLAAIIASQAIITGSYTTYKLAMELKHLPRVEIKSTSPKHPGQIYITSVNWMLLIACMFVVLFFQRSDALGDAYGLAVTGAFIGTTLLMSSCLYITNYLKPWRFWTVAPLLMLFLIFDTAFFSSNLGKIPTGGWFPILVSIILATTMMAWRKGTSILYRKMPKEEIKSFLQRLKNEEALSCIEGTRVYMTMNTDKIPATLLLDAMDGYLHKKILLVSVETKDHPWGVNYEHKLLGRMGGDNIELYEVKIEKGYMRSFVHVPHILDALNLGDENRQYVFGHWQVKVPFPPRKNVLLKYFSLIYRLLPPMTRHFRTPKERVIYMGGEIEISL